MEEYGERKMAQGQAEYRLNLREQGYKLDISEERIRPFEEKILASGMCDFAVDMSFSRYDGRRRMIYDCHGYVALKELNLQDVRSLMAILEKTLMALQKAGEFFIDRDLVLLNTDTVFYNTKSRDIRIAYYPLREGQPVGMAVAGLLEDLIALTGDRGREYLLRLKGIFYRNNCDIPDMLVVVRAVRRELFK